MIYLFLGISFLGWGLIADSFLHFRKAANSPYLAEIWMGWAVVLFLVQLANIFLPINARLSLPLFLLGVVFLVISRRHALAWNLNLRRGDLMPLALIALCVVWIALRSMTQSPGHYDSGLYHFAAIKWSTSYPIVRGLANLHGRLGFNSSLFPFVAAVDAYPYFNHGHQIANSFLLVLSVVSILVHLRPVFKHPGLLTSSHPFRFLADVFALPALAYLGVQSELSSPSPDMTSTIVQIMLFLLLCNSLAQWREGAPVPDFQAVLVFTLAATAVTIKLSNLVFATTTASLIAVLHMKTARRSIMERSKLFIPGGAVFILWCLRGALLSGAPLYPSTIGYLPFNWSVPRESIRQEALAIFRWARRAGYEWNNMLSDWSWLRSWWYQRSTDFFSFRYPLYFSGLFVLLASIMRRFAARKSIQLLDWSILILPAASLLYWFITAPDLRFANATLPILGISSCLLLLLFFSSKVPAKVFTFIVLIVFFVGNLPYISYAVENKWQLKPCAQVGTWFDCFPKTDWKPIPEVTLTTEITLSGLQLFIPTASDQCWDAPLPCTPVFNPDLKLIEQGDLSSGFMLEPK